MKKRLFLFCFMALSLSAHGQSALSVLPNSHRVRSSGSDFEVIQNKKGLYNHLNTQTGDTLSNQWWIYATEFSNGVAVVHKRSVQNFLLKNGKFLLKHWYPIVLNDKGLLIVYNNANKFNFADITFPDIVLYNRWFSVESEYDEIIERERAKLAKELAKQNKKSR